MPTTVILYLEEILTRQIMNEQWVNCICQECGLWWADSFIEFPVFECPRCESMNCTYKIAPIDEDWDDI